MGCRVALPIVLVVAAVAAAGCGGAAGRDDRGSRGDAARAEGGPGTAGGARGEPDAAPGGARGAQGAAAPGGARGGLDSAAGGARGAQGAADGGARGAQGAAAGGQRHGERPAVRRRDRHGKASAPGRDEGRPIRRARCAPSLANCAAATGRVVYVEAHDPDGDGDLHLVVLGGDVTAPGLTVFDIERELRPRRTPRVGDLASAAGPVYRGSYGQRQIQATELHVRPG